MVKVVHPRPSTELPSELLAQLEPNLRQLYSTLPSALAARISVLVRQALPQGIHPNRVLKFAFLHASAERLAQGDAVSREHTKRSKLELAGEIHGLRNGYRDGGEAKKRYRLGREARQHVKASLEALEGQWQVFRRVVKKHRSSLPTHLQSRFSDAILRDVGKIFQNMGIAITLDEEDLASEKGLPRERSEIAQTYIWWCSKLPRYRGKWKDMQLLAFAWKMSPAATVQSFRTVVNRICKRALDTHALTTSLETILSEK